VGFRAAVDEEEILDIERFAKTGDGGARYSVRSPVACLLKTICVGRFRIRALASASRMLLARSIPTGALGFCKGVENEIGSRRFGPFLLGVLKALLLGS
jgi:hypothetical protein